MITNKIGTRGVLVSFDDPYYTNVYLIFGKKHVFVLDTFLGNDSMKIVHDVIASEGSEDMPVVIFNSHADYDHYWGNGAFKDAVVIGHEQCKKRILVEGEAALKKYVDHQRGEIELLPPSRTFRESLRFGDEGVKFFHTPGHSLDSSSCFDEKDRVLFVGDNVESPIPYLYHANFDQYIQTLESYLEVDPKFMIAGHDKLLENTDLVKKNIDYISKFRDWTLDLDAMSTQELHRHVDHNLNALKIELMKSDKKQEFLNHLEELKEFNK